MVDLDVRIDVAFVAATLRRRCRVLGGGDCVYAVAESQHIEEHVARAQSCRAKLEVLEVELTTGHIDTTQATSEFIRCVDEVSFLDAR